MGGKRGLIKGHGRLVPVTARYDASAAEGFSLSAGDVAVSVSPYEEMIGRGEREADARLRIGRHFEVGYGGFYRCTQ
jgi:hypothetical protein